MACVLLILTAACGGAAPADALEREAQGIDRSLMCPVCPGETIDQSQVEQAKQMRALVREMLAEGRSRQEVLDYFSEPTRYGPRVLAEPPRRGFTLLAWAVPPLGLLAGGVAFWLIVRAMRRAGREARGGAPAEAGLEGYMARVDREVASGGAAAEPPQGARDA